MELASAVGGRCRWRPLANQDRFFSTGFFTDFDFSLGFGCDFFFPLEAALGLRPRPWLAVGLRREAGFVTGFV